MALLFCSLGDLLHFKFLCLSNYHRNFVALLMQALSFGAALKLLKCAYADVYTYIYHVLHVAFGALFTLSKF